MEPEHTASESTMTSSTRAEWLYPILDGAGRRFSGPKGTMRGLDYADYRRAVLAGRIDGGSGALESGFRSMKVGDCLWLFLDTGVGVIGRGTVVSLSGRPEPYVEFTLDRDETAILAQDPVSSDLVRRSLPGVIEGPVPLVQHEELARGLAWWIDGLGERDQRWLEPFGVPPLRSVLARQPSLLNEPSLAALVRALRSRDLALGLVTVPDLGPALVACDDSVLIVGRGVNGGPGARPTQALKSLGLLAWSAWSLAQPTSGEKREPVVWLACRTPPTADFVHFVEHLGHSISWVQNGQHEFGPRTRLRWQSPLGKAGLPLEQRA
jgi:hypothetical protein